MNTLQNAGTDTSPLFFEAPPAPGTALAHDDVVPGAVDPAIVAAIKQAGTWGVWPGDPDRGVHSFYDFVCASEVGEGELVLEPTLTSFYGHEIVAPAGVDIIQIRRFRKVRLIIVTLLRVAPGVTQRVLAWQGDNDTIHLLAPLPGEDEYLGVYHAIVFGKRKRDDVVREEGRAHYLRSLEYGDTAVLDADVTLLDTKFSPAAMAQASLKA